MRPFLRTNSSTAPRDPKCGIRYRYKGSKILEYKKFMAGCKGKTLRSTARFWSAFKGLCKSFAADVHKGPSELKLTSCKSRLTCVICTASKICKCQETSLKHCQEVAFKHCNGSNRNATLACRERKGFGLCNPESYMTNDQETLDPTAAARDQNTEFRNLSLHDCSL